MQNTLTPATWSPSIMFCTLWPWSLTFWCKNYNTSRLSQEHSLHQVWRLWNHSFLVMLWTNREKERDTHTHGHYRLQYNFCYLWPCDLDLWPFDLILNELGLMMDYPVTSYLLTYLRICLVILSISVLGRPARLQKSRPIQMISGNIWAWL